MQSEVRRVLESMRGNGWDAYWFWNKIDAAERADAARREEPRNVTFSDVVDVRCGGCGMQIFTTEYAVRCNCGTTIMVHRHNRKVDDGLRKAVDLPPACTPTDEHIRTIATQAVRDAMPDVLDMIADSYGEYNQAVFGGGYLRHHATKLRKDRGA